MGQQRFSCKQCSKKYEHKRNLKAHVRDAHAQGDEDKRRLQCLQCTPSGVGRCYASHNSLRSHIRIVHEGKKHLPSSCTLCSQAFQQSSALYEHMRSVHTGERPFLCKQKGCGKSFASAGWLQTHCKTHLDVKAHRCSHCHKTFVRPCDMKSHIRVHTGEKPFPCTECGRQFRHPHVLRLHLRRHSGMKPFKCTYCPYSAVIPRLLQNHLRTHTGEKPFKCDHCPSSFSSRNVQLRHVESQHSEPRSRPRSKCSYCDKEYVSRSGLRYHVRTQHWDKNCLPVKCEICSEQLESQASYRQHKSTHNPLEKRRRYVCHFCQILCATKSGLTVHLTRRHTGEKPCKCRICGKAWSTMSGLWQHEKTHTRTSHMKPLEGVKGDHKPPNSTKAVTTTRKPPLVKLHELRVVLPRLQLFNKFPKMNLT